MSNLPKSLKEKCGQHFTYTALEQVKVQESRVDGTRKFLFALIVQVLYIKTPPGFTYLTAFSRICFCSFGISSIMSLPELQEEMLLLSEKPYRAKQLYDWMHVKLARGYEAASRYRYVTLADM